MKTITVFGTRHSREGDPDYDNARKLGRMLAEAGFGVTSGGYGGAMEAVSRGAHDVGGHTRGITMSIFDPLPANVYLVEEQKVLNFFLRLERLIFDSDAYIVLNGGIGTITELGLTWSLLQTHGVPSRPLVLIGEHWAALMGAFRAHCIIQPADYDLVCLVDTVDEAVSLIRERVK
jgi:uncharacterized protein (TIGR00730 family)